VHRQEPHGRRRGGRRAAADAKGELKETVDKIVAAAPHAVVPKSLAMAPTKDNLDKVAAL
jgi:hypothetical protein